MTRMVPELRDTENWFEPVWQQYTEFIRAFVHDLSPHELQMGPKKVLEMLCATRDRSLKQKLENGEKKGAIFEVVEGVIKKLENNLSLFYRRFMHRKSWRHFSYVYVKKKARRWKQQEVVGGHSSKIYFICNKNLAL